MTTGRAFVAFMLLFGVVLGAVLLSRPEWRDTSVPVLMGPLLIGLAGDLLIQGLARRGRATPLTMNERALGIIGSAAIAVAMTALA